MSTRLPVRTTSLEARSSMARPSESRGSHTAPLDAWVRGVRLDVARAGRTATRNGERVVDRRPDAILDRRHRLAERLAVERVGERLVAEGLEARC